MAAEKKHAPTFIDACTKSPNEWNKQADGSWWDDGVLPALH